MKKTKRMLCLLLVMVLTFTLTACGGGDSGSREDAGDADASGGEHVAAQDYSEKITVSWAEVIEGDEGIDYTQDDVYKYFADTFNAEIEITPLTWGNWVENLRIWINSGDMPDVVNWYYVHSEFMDYVDQGLVRQFPEDWKERWPSLAALYEQTGLGPQLDAELGATYCFPTPIYFNNKPTETLTQHLQTYIRKDWVEAVGMEVKDYYTYDELLEMARLMKEQDPGGVGSNFYPITSYSGMLIPGLVSEMAEHALGDGVFYKGEDGKYHWGAADEETYEALKWVQDAWKEGLIHPEFYTLNQGEDEDMMTIAGTSAIFWAGGLASNYTMFANEMTQSGLDPETSLMSAFLVDSDGFYHGIEAANYFGALLFNPDMDDATFERVMDILEYAASGEGQLMTHIGFEGVDYEIADDGSISMLHENDPLSVYPSIRFFQTLGTRGDDFSIGDPSYPAAYREKQKKQYEEKYSLLGDDTFARIDWNVQFHSSDAMNRAGFDYSNEYSALITKEGDLRANWENWVNEKMSLVQPLLDELDAK